MSSRWLPPSAVVCALLAWCALPTVASADIWEDLWPLVQESYGAGAWADCLDNVQICFDNAPKAKRGQAAAMGAKCAANKGDGVAYDAWARRAGGALSSADRAALEARLGRKPVEKAVAPVMPRVPRAAAPADEPEADAEPPEPPDPEVAAHPGMSKVSAGQFWMGCNDRLDADCKDDEKPGRREQLDAFWMDRHEVTVAEFRACVAAGACTEPRGGGSCTWGQAARDEHPVTCVGRDQARAYCRFVGKRLPTEIQWEKAARSIDARRFPWGEKPVSCVLAVWGDGPNPDGCGANGPKPVCSAQTGNSNYDLCDLAGNVYEWVDDPYATYDPATNSGKAAADAPGVIRGGSWFNGSAADLRTSARVKYDPAKGNGALGFRCVAPSTSP